jgi:asparagine synthase (glutamine-hydrolysing)
MCGIAGVMTDVSSEECRCMVSRMNEAMIHRGPDDEGVWSENGFSFGMRRLSIIDLHGGHQPMWDESSQVGIVFNGEIFNYRELRDNWDDKQVRWFTQSDTEVVLKSFVHSGLDAIQTWNGMFAVALWERTKRRLTLIRDRMGVKPLYYYWDGKTFLFASEIKAILASGIIPRKLSQQAIWDFLTYRYVPGVGTVWNNIYKVPPGHILQIGAGGSCQPECYWKCDVIESGDNGTTWDGISALREFEELFKSAVNLRLIASDVPVGVFLSGGLDSSAIAVAAVELGHEKFHTFSVGYENSQHSELKYARVVAKHVGAVNHEFILREQDFLTLIPEVVAHSDEPLADLTMAPLLGLARMARNEVKVVLSGEGSDEVLGGYDLDINELRWSKIRTLQSLPSPVLRFSKLVGRAFLPSRIQKVVERLARIPLRDWNRDELPFMGTAWSQEEKEKLWKTESLADSKRILESEYASAASHDPLQQLLSVYQKSWLVEDLLMKADKTTMAASLEARTPFLDFRLVEWANHQPNQAKVKRLLNGRFETKSILRAFCRSRLPQEILERPKRGFPIPANEWLRGGLRSWTKDLLFGPGSRVYSAFSKAVMQDSLNDALGGDPKATAKIWNIIILELWLRHWKISLG